MVLKGLPVLYFANMYLNLLLISTGEIMLLSMIISWDLTFNTVLINCTPDRRRWGRACLRLQLDNQYLCKNCNSLGKYGRHEMDPCVAGILCLHFGSDWICHLFIQLQFFALMQFSPVLVGRFMFE